MCSINIPTHNGVRAHRPRPKTLVPRSLHTLLHIIFYEVDSMHESWELPDDEIVFRCVSAGSYQVNVSRDMLPSV